VFFAILLMFPRHQITLLDLSNQRPSEELTLKTNSWTYPIEPFISIPDYFLSFYDVKNQLISWLCWIVFFVVIFTVLQKKFMKILPGIILAILWFITFCLYVIFLPVNKYYAIPTAPNLALIDFHSHTIYSHDGLATPRYSIWWHKRNGFNTWFITDHNSTNGVAVIRDMVQRDKINSKICYGQEISDKHNNHLLVLGLKKLNPPYSTEETKNIVKYVHNNGGAVIVAHWWEDRGSGFEKLYKSGVDGFEIYSHTKKMPAASEILKTIAFCREKNLIMTGGTNWHGWGARNDVWTTVKIEDWQKMQHDEVENIIVNSIRNRKTDMFRTVIIDRNEPKTNLRVVFEPFVGLYYCFIGLNIWQRIVWLFWLSIMWLIIEKHNAFSTEKKNKLISYVYIVLSLFLLFCGILCFIKWGQVAQYNHMLKDCSLFLASLAVLWGLAGAIKR